MPLHLFVMERKIYIATDRKVIRDYELLADVGVLYRFDWKTRRFPDININFEEDVVFSLCSKPLGNNPLTINKDNAKAKANNKPLTRKILKQNKVPIPRTWYDVKDVKFPYVARPKYHTFGFNFYVINNLQEHKQMLPRYQSGWYFTEFYNFDREYRVIVFGDDILSSFRKDVEGLNPQELVKQRFSDRRTETLSSARVGIKEEEITERQKQICRDAVKVLGLDYGGVDLFVRGNDFVVCEVNSAPTIRNFFAEKLKDKIKGYGL